MKKRGRPRKDSEKLDKSSVVINDDNKDNSYIAKNPRFKKLFDKSLTAKLNKLIKQLEKDENAELFLEPVDYLGTF